MVFIKPYMDHNPDNDALWVVVAEIHEYRDNIADAIKALKNAKRILERSSSQHKQDNMSYLNDKLQQLSRRT